MGLPTSEEKKIVMTKRNTVLAIFTVGTIGLIGCATSSKTEAPASGPSQAATAPAPKAVEPAPSERMVHFAFDSSALDSKSHKIVEAHARYLATHPEMSVKLEGHADERGTRTYNQALGERRAQSIANALRALGVEGKRINIVSYGEDKPVAVGRDEQAWAQNRRGVIIE